VLTAARAGQDLADINAVPDAFDERGLPVIHLARVIEYDIGDRVGNGTGELIVLLSTITNSRRVGSDNRETATSDSGAVMPPGTPSPALRLPKGLTARGHERVERRRARCPPQPSTALAVATPVLRAGTASPPFVGKFVLCGDPA
jgi:hypothetical protein